MNANTKENISLTIETIYALEIQIRNESDPRKRDNLHVTREALMRSILDVVAKELDNAA